MKDSEDRKLPDDPEIEPEMYMFFNRLLSENAPDKKEEPESEISPDDDALDLIFGKMNTLITGIAESLIRFDEKQQKDKTDTDERIARLEMRIGRMDYPDVSATDNSEANSRIAVLTKLVSEMVSMMKIYTGMMKAYTGASA